MTRAALHIGVDAGTSSCKAVLADESWRVVSTAQRSYPTRRTADGEVTQDARDWLAATVAVVRACADAAGGRVASIGITAPAHNVVLVDGAGEPLERVVLWSDVRCAATAARLEREIGPLVLERAFARLGPSWTLAQLAWLRHERPELWNRIRHVLPAKDFLRRRLGGTATTDPSDAAGTAMYDQRAGRWLREALAAAGLTADQLPEVVPATQPGGGVSRHWAGALGVTPGAPLAVGATDTAAELVALGAIAPGDALVKIASTGTVVGVSAEPHPDPRVLTYPHAAPDRWYTLAATNTAAAAYTWLRETLFGGDAAAVSSYADMDEIASPVEPGAGGLLFLPFLQGERCPHWDPALRGAFAGLAAWHGRAHLCRAVLEGVAFSLRDCRDLLAELGIPVRRPHLGGGGVASAVWRRVLVAALGEDGVLQDPAGPALGAAMLAAHAAGGGSAWSAPGALAATRTVVSPDPAWTAAYDRLHPVYRRTSLAMAAISHDLAEAAHSA